MAQTKNIGTCLLCKQEIAHRSIIKHLSQCTIKNVEDGPGEIFLFKVSGKSPTEALFWLYIEINGAAKLKKLDLILRDVWLECCGHLSEFNINGKRYTSDEGLGKSIQHLFEVGTEFDYEYDFGSTTWLKGKAISARPGNLPQQARLVAQNNLPDTIKCLACQQRPDVICPVCYQFFCNSCTDKHQNCEDEEIMLPVVNSPRMGVCGYCGPGDE